jgi:chaperonin GroEL
VAVHAPGFGDRRKALLSDIAVLTGGRVVSGDIGLTLENVELEMLGEARRVIVGKEFTTIISDINKEAVLSRYEQLRRQLETMDSAYEKEKLKERLSKLSGGVAIVNVGAPTETEMKDRKLRLEDAVNATKAALEEGLVPGGGATLAHISGELSEWAKDTLLEDELIGAVLVEKALSAPLKKIASNAGQSGTVIFERVKATKFEFGYNAENQSKQRSKFMFFPFSLEDKKKTLQFKEDIKYDIFHFKSYYKKEAFNLDSIPSNLNYQFNKTEDMFKIGVIDPAKVTRSALQNAASIASMILTTECIIVDKKH